MKQDNSFGKIELVIDECLKNSGLTKNKLAYKAELQRTQLNNYLKGNIQRLDIAVLCRLCYALQCDLHDIIRYVPPEQK